MDNESITPLFWKIFGGAVFGLIGVLLVVILNSLHSNTTSIRTELTTTVAQHKLESDSQINRIKDELVSLNTKMVGKSDIAPELSKLKDELASVKTQLAAIEESRNSIREKLSTLEANFKEVIAHNKQNDIQSQEFREKFFTQIRELREKVLVLENKTPEKQ